MAEYSKGTWKLGNNHGDVVTDCGDGFPHESGHTATDYYGGFLIAESICKKEDSQLIIAAPEMVQMLIDHRTRISELRDIMEGQHSMWSHHRQMFNDLINESEELINKALGVKE